MSERIKIYFENSGVGRNELKDEGNGSFTFNVGRDGFDARSSRDQWWMVDQLKNMLDEETKKDIRDNDLKYKIGKYFPDKDNLIGSVEISI